MPRAAEAEICFEVDEELYPLEAVQSAAYAFTDRAYVRFERVKAGRLKLCLTPKEGCGASRDALKGEFDNELVHQVLRRRVSENNQKIREFIVTKALVSAQPVGGAAAAAPDGGAQSQPCRECEEAPQAAPAQIDEALEKEIDRLLAEIERGDGEGDPLEVSVPWEEKFGAKEKKPAKSKSAGGRTKES